MKKTTTHLAAALFTIGSWLAPAPAITLEEARSPLIADNSAHTIDLKVVVDQELINRDEQWWDRIRQAVDASSKAFSGTFDYGVEVDSLELGSLDDVSDSHYLHNEVMIEHPAGEQDAVVFFTGKPATQSNGVAAHNGNHVIIFRDDNAPTDNVLTHELSHLLGAYDYTPDHPMFYHNNYMSYLYMPISERWDPSSIAIMKERLDEGFKDPYHADARIATFLSDFKKEDWDIARRFYLHASGASPKEDAGKLAHRLLHSYPDNIRLRMHTAKLFFKQGRERDALLQYERAYELLDGSELDNKTKADVLNTIAYKIADDTKRRAFKGLDALTLAAEAFLLDGTPEILDTLGWVNHKLGNYVHAAEELDVAASMAEGGVKSIILEHLVDTYKASGDVDGMFYAYEKLFAHDTHNGMHYFNAVRDFQLIQRELSADERERILQIGIEGYSLFPTGPMAVRVRRAYFMNLLSFAKEPERAEQYESIVETILREHNLEVER